MTLVWRCCAVWQASPTLRLTFTRWTRRTTASRSGGRPASTAARASGSKCDTARWKSSGRSTKTWCRRRPPSTPSRVRHQPSHSLRPLGQAAVVALWSRFGENLNAIFTFFRTILPGFVKIASRKLLMAGKFDNSKALVKFSNGCSRDCTCYQLNWLSCSWLNLSATW